MVDLSTVAAAQLVAPKQPYANSPASVKDAATDTTFIAFLGLDRDLYVTYWDHTENRVGPAVLADSRLIAADDNHSAPSMCIDNAGTIHIVWGSHETQHRHVRSDSPKDISAWTAATITGVGTYPSVHCDPSSGDLYLIDRAGDGTSHGAPFPSHAYASLRKSTDQATWSSAVALIDTTGAPESDTDAYVVFGSEFGPDGFLHISWSVARGTGHDDSRENVYHAKLDPTDDNLYAADDTALGTEITWAEHPDCLAATKSDVTEGFMAVNSATDITITYSAPQSGDRVHHAVRWDGTSWSNIDPTIDAPDFAGLQMPFFNGGSLFGLFTTEVGADLELWEYDAGWSKVETLQPATAGQGWDRVAPVTDGVALAMQTMVTADTSATVDDLLALYLIDESIALVDPPKPNTRYASRFD